MPIFKSIKPGASLGNIINYVSREFEQTQDTDTIKGVNVADNPEIAKLQMLNTKNSFGKNEGRQYQHYVLSFSANEKITAKEAVKYATAHAEKCFGNRFEVFLALHQESNGKKMHVHYIVNSVSFMDGKKIQTSKDDYEYFRDANDTLAKQHGFPVIDRSSEAVKERGRPQLYSQNEYQNFKRKAGKDILSSCGRAVFKVIKNNPKNFEDFQKKLSHEGWQAYMRGKNLVFLNIETNQKIRANTLAKKLNAPKLSTAQILKTCNSANWEKFKVINKKERKEIETQLTGVVAKLKNLKVAEDVKVQSGFSVHLRDDDEYSR